MIWDRSRRCHFVYSFTGVRSVAAGPRSSAGALGRTIARGETLGSTGIKGMFLGMLIALALGLVDALWLYSLRQFHQVIPRVFVCVAIGTVGGLLGGVVGQFLYDEFENLAAFSNLRLDAHRADGRRLDRQLRLPEELGTRGRTRLSRLKSDSRRGWGSGRRHAGRHPGLAAGRRLGPSLSRQDDLWSPSLTGFMALGLCIGLMIALAQVVLKDAWLKIEEGFRAGRELLVNKPVLTIGRAESCDLGLFGDSMIEKLHARIYQQDGQYLIADNASTHGTFVNDQRIAEPTLLRTGDLIRVGNAYVRFSERKKPTK